MPTTVNYTENYDLAIIPAESNQVTFSNWRNLMAGNDSNMTKIDAALGDKPDKVIPSVDGNITALDANGNLIDGGITINKLQSATNELTAETELVDADYVPFYDTSTSVHKKSLWSNIISKIRTALFGTSNGLLKSNGSGVISVAAAGTDYAIVDHNHNADAITDGTTNKVFTSIEKTKLSNIANNANNYTHPSTAGNKHVPTGGAANQVLKYSENGTAVWGDIDIPNPVVVDTELTEMGQNPVTSQAIVEVMVGMSNSFSDDLDSKANSSHSHTASSIGAVPTSLTINGKDLSANITLSATDVSAIPISSKNEPYGVAGLDTEGKVNALQACSKIIDVTVNTTITATHYGAFVSVSNASARTVTIPQGLAVGAEFEVYRKGSGSVTLVPSGVVSFECAETTYAIVKRYTSVICKCVASNVWNIQGSIGVSE